MRKIAIIGSGVLIAIVLLHIGYFMYVTTGDDCNSAEKDEVRRTIETVLKIKYGWASKNRLEELTTEGFQENLDPWSFYEGLRFYAIDKDFMESWHEERPGVVTVAVAVYAPDILIPIFTLTKQPNGQYLISDVSYDI